MDIKSIFGKKKIIIGMAHFPPLPGFPLYDDSQGVDYILRRIKDDVKNLQDGGVDYIMFCNENDRPYRLKADYTSVAVMGRTIGEISREIKVPFGVDILWDPIAAIAVAKATKASFIREIVTGTYVSDMGLWNTNVGELYRYRKLIDANNIAIFFNISAEFAYNLDRRPLEEIAESVVFSSLADAILISGPKTGTPPSVEVIQKVKEKVKDVPVFVNTGLNMENAKELLKVADGAIVGTSLKKNGVTWNPVDPERVKKFIDKVNSVV
jgi:membrane complex biogenesis BtpA family protein